MRNNYAVQINQSRDVSIFNQPIYTQEQAFYDFLKNQENDFLGNLNSFGVRLWRYKEKYFYKTTWDADPIVGNKKKITQELSSRYFTNIYIVKDLNDVVLGHTRRTNTLYLSLNAIPVIEDEIFNTSTSAEFIDYFGISKRNLLKHTVFLQKRFNNYFIDDKQSWIDYLLSNIKQSDKSDLIFKWLGSYFKTLNNTQKALVLMENKNVSVDILWQRIIKPIFGYEYCIRITDEILEAMSLDEIVANKLFFLIDHIPENEKHKNKLAKLMECLLVYKSVQNKNTRVYGQVLIALDSPHLFLGEFLSSCNVIYIKKFKEIMNILEAKDRADFYQKIHNSLSYFSEELSTVESYYDTLQNCKTDNERFLKEITEINVKEKEIQNDKLIIDPFKENFYTYLPNKERYKHTYITGQTGSGKSDLIKVLVMADILRADGSVVLLEPHGDLAENITNLIHDKTRLVYINPFISDSKIPTINLFHTNDRSETNIANLTQVILSVLKGVNADETLTGTMEDVLEMCIRVLLRKGQSSFQELYRFLNDNRNKDLVKLGIDSPNPLESEFFEDDFANSKPTKDAVRRRLKKLLNDPIFSNLMNGNNTINLESAINTKGKIIVFNIPKGKMTNTYKYYIRFIVEYIQILALKRADVMEENRVHTHLYIDEAHNFITSSSSTISEILAESRKYKLFMTFAHQSVAQIKDASLRDMLATMTNIKIIGKNSNKTLEVMNKTLKTKLEDVEKLDTGEFYLSAGNNDIVKIKVTDKLVNGKKDISHLQKQEQIQYQLEHYYRTIENHENVIATPEEINKKVDDFIKAIKSLDINFFNNVSNNKQLYNELVYNFEDKQHDTDGYISKQDLYLYFNLVYSYNYFQDNKQLLKLLKKDNFFIQNVNINKTYNGKKRLAISKR